MAEQKLKKVNPEVLYAQDDLFKIDRSCFDDLKKKCLENSRQRIRICTHKNSQDSLHEMLIVHTKDTFVRPHKHINKSESVHIIEGIVDIVIFHEDGHILDLIKMGDYASGCQFYYRMDKEYYHTLLIKSPFLIFHEITSGPFCEMDTIFPEWAPAEDDVDGRIQFDNRLKGLILRRNGSVLGNENLRDL